MSGRRLGCALVTGGAGFIGTALARAAADRFDRWVVMDNLHPQVHAVQERPNALPDAVELIRADVTEREAWDDLFHGSLRGLRPDVVVHLAAETGTAQSLTESSRHGRVNVVGTTEMLDAFGRHGGIPRHVVLSSSRAVYGEGLWRRPDGSTYYPGLRDHAQLAEGRWDHEGSHVPNSVAGTAPAPTSVYGATKLAQEHILQSWCGAQGVPLSVLRLQNVYGPGQSLTNAYTGIVSLFAQLARDGRTIPLYEDGKITRDFVLIDDVVSAVVATIACPPASGRRTVDIGTGTRTTIADLAGEMAKFYSAPAPRVSGQFRDGDVRHAACDITATTAELGWRPRWTLSEGIAALAAWIEEQRGG